MIEPTPRAPDLEAGLAEIDRRLREIQQELSGVEPVDEVAAIPVERRTGRSGPLEDALQRTPRTRPRPPQAPPAGHEQLEDLRREIAALSDLRDRLLASIRALLDGYQAIAHVQPGVGRRAGQPHDVSSEVTLSVGPFTDVDDVRAFERAVGGLPGVRETSIRGYEGSDRAIVDVRLGRADRPEAPGADTS